MVLSLPPVTAASTPNFSAGATETNFTAPPRFEVEAVSRPPVPWARSTRPMFSDEMARLMCRPL